MLTESEKFKGFYKLPFPNCIYVINQKGVVANEVTGKIRKNSTNERGYLAIDLRIGFPKVYRRFLVHRLVAWLFIEKPERHKDKDFSILQVNHKNGNKADNRDVNLEWVTGEENIQHAIENSLYGTEKIVQARHVETDEVLEFRSISECARWLCMAVSRLSIHLHSVCAGMIEKDGYIFKFKDEEWPERISYDKDTTTIHHVADVIAENVETGTKLLCKSLTHAIAYVDLSKNRVMNHRARHGSDVPYQGWIFYQFNPKGDQNYTLRR